MEKKDLELILANFGPEKEFIGDGYFRSATKATNIMKSPIWSQLVAGQRTTTRRLLSMSKVIRWFPIPFWI